MRRSLVLDFDHSVHAPSGASVVALSDLQEEIRFGCTMPQLRALRRRLAAHLPARGQVFFLGSGDFHHVSYLLIDCTARDIPIEVVVMDNHPDNMRYPLGVHCGSWVRRVARLGRVAHVHVVGITSPDVAAKRLWENYLEPLCRGRLSYWCIGDRLRWPRWLPFRAALRCHPDAESLLDAFRERQSGARNAVYLSIDKDVLRPSEVQTGWDQGVLCEKDLHAVVSMLRHRIVASDISGDPSTYRYRRAWKRWLVARDAKPEMAPGEMAMWQERHHALNERLLATLAGSMAAPDAIAAWSSHATRSNASSVSQ